MTNAIKVDTALIVDSCPLCGWRGTWKNVNGANREAQNCGGCDATLRYRNQAASILTQLGRGRYAAIRDLVRDTALTADASIFEFAIRSPFIKHFSAFRNYVRGYFLPNIKVGDSQDGIRCEDLTQLTFKDNSFNLFVTSDTMKHVLQYEQAFKEIFRVLRPGGAHVFTTPIAWPMPTSTVRRAEEIGGEIIHHLEARFHRASDGIPALVCTEFGFDLLNLLEEIGYDAWFERPSLMRNPGYFDAVVVCRKPRETTIQNISTAK
jgi:SAM-dependent methyltransferase